MSGIPNFTAIYEKKKTDNAVLLGEIEKNLAPVSLVRTNRS